MSESLLPCVEIDPPGPVRASVIWLHGLGADGHDFEPIVPELGLPADLGVRFVFPHAPKIPVSINAGMVMPAWYDIRDLDLRNRHDEGGLAESVEHVRRLLARERETLASERILLAGFSQGGAVALQLALRHPEPLAGILALSCYLVNGDLLDAERHAANQGVPILQCHGLFDPMVPVDRGEAARDWLVTRDYDVTWKTYPMQHQVCMEQILDVGAWLRERLAAPQGSDVS